jgi:hypothetical protein
MQDRFAAGSPPFGGDLQLVAAAERPRSCKECAAPILRRAQQGVLRGGEADASILI